MCCAVSRCAWSKVVLSKGGQTRLRCCSWQLAYLTSPCGPPRDWDALASSLPERSAALGRALWWDAQRCPWPSGEVLQRQWHRRCVPSPGLGVSPGPPRSTHWRGKETKQRKQSLERGTPPLQIQRLALQQQRAHVVIKSPCSVNSPTREQGRKPLRRSLSAFGTATWQNCKQRGTCGRTLLATSTRHGAATAPC